MRERGIERDRERYRLMKRDQKERNRERVRRLRD